MSAFKRKTPTKQASPGTQLYPGSPSTIIVSTGIPSLDDILGGGLPLSCSLLIAAPDPHSSYSELVQKYYIAQGLTKGHNILLIHHDGKDFAKGCMWTPGVTNTNARPEDDDEPDRDESKIKIAWRYEEMKQFQTTVSPQSSEEFCSTLDLTCRVPESLIDRAMVTKQLRVLDVGYVLYQTSTSVIQNIEQALAESSSSIPFRICIPSFGSLEWGDVTSADVGLFLHNLRALLWRYPHACASVSLVPHIASESWGGPGWTQKLGWLVDAFVNLSAFSSNPALTALSPSHHGLLDIYTLPAPHTLLSPSDKHSVLRGLSSAAMSAGGSGENNLAFKCTRKRLIFETLHLDVEGGVGERRTAPSGFQTDDHTPLTKTASASLDVRLDEDEGFNTLVPAFSTPEPPPTQTADTNRVEERVPRIKKPKKRVAFHSDRPDLYDF
ncbi:hypothetical protein BDZ89DRAFT_1011253 [Hymenopellis radicata]|nr:hypothetical protein BDZ89DRAFT_1011253 [Hymenopellis radicata]